ncbi:MAG: recombinase family protein [Rhodospirillaceae bacterium]
MLTVLGGLAEFERELIKVRTGEGRARATAAGQSLGRPFKLTAQQREKIRLRRAAGETPTALANIYSVRWPTIRRVLRPGALP